jgi:hypothetical protein
MAIPHNGGVLLGRREGAAALTEAGYRTASATLATLAARGSGPIYRRYGPGVIYRWGDLLDWAQSRLSPPMRSTSERDRIIAEAEDANPEAPCPLMCNLPPVAPEEEAVDAPGK